MPKTTTPRTPDGAATDTTTRLAVPRTAKMLVGGAFIRSESGRVHPTCTPDGQFLANIPTGSRKDARDAVRAARTGHASWAGLTGHNRGQILYRLAEMTEGRTAQLAAEIAASEGCSTADATVQVHAAIDRIIWHAGWCDKLAQALGSVNPVTGPHGSTSEPVGTGVVAAAAPAAGSLLGLVAVTVPALTGGSAVITVASPTAPLPAVTFAEIVATSDVSAGAVNILTGHPAEILPHLASHADVNAVDLSGITDPELAAQLERSAADTVKRVRRPQPGEWWTKAPGLGAIRFAVDTRTTWTPTGR